jgi:uncharacterized protein (DUF433 family)
MPTMGAQPMDWRERIEANPDVLVGKPVVKGTRMAVEFVIGLMAQGWSEEDILNNYRHLKREDIRACLGYAEYVLTAERIYPMPS